MIKRVSVVVLSAAMLVLQGCAPSCDDVCDHFASCTVEFGGDEPTDSAHDECVSDCERGLCGRASDDEKEQNVRECIVGVACGSGALSFAGKTAECFVTHCL